VAATLFFLCISIRIEQSILDIFMLNPNSFIGAGAFFAFMSYVPDATFGIAATTE
jgi:hypothetical protein